MSILRGYSHTIFVSIAATIAAVLVTAALLMVGSRPVQSVSIPLKHPEAIVLLAGSYEERSPTVVSLYRAGFAGRILLTDDGVRRGWSKEHQRNLYTTERGVNDLVQQGIPRKAITSLPFLKSGTVYDALAVRDYALKNNIRSILLVTSDYHAHRSLWIFQRVLQQLPVTVGIEPAPSSATIFPEIMLEYIKYVYYLIRFGVLDDIPDV